MTWYNNSKPGVLPISDANTLYIRQVPWRPHGVMPMMFSKNAVSSLILIVCLRHSVFITLLHLYFLLRFMWPMILCRRIAKILYLFRRFRRFSRIPPGVSSQWSRYSFSSAVCSPIHSSCHFSTVFLFVRASLLQPANGLSCCSGWICKVRNNICWSCIVGIQ